VLDDSFGEVLIASAVLMMMAGCRCSYTIKEEGFDVCEVVVIRYLRE